MLIRVAFIALAGLCILGCSQAEQTADENPAQVEEPEKKDEPFKLPEWPGSIVDGGIG